MDSSRQRDSVEDAIRGFFATRPARSVHERKIAGVCAAVARRYAIDPLLVRVALLVLGLFGGSGILFYLLGWLLLAEGEDEVSPFEGLLNRGRSSMSTGFTLVLCVALLPVSSWVFGGGFLFGGALAGSGGVALLAVAWFFLHRARAHLGSRSASAPESGPQPGPQPGAQSSAQSAAHSAPLAAPLADSLTLSAPALTSPLPTRGTDQSPTAPPRSTMRQWDPLGAAPSAWELPEPVSPARTPSSSATISGGRRTRAKVIPSVLVCALLSAGVCVTIAPFTGGWMSTLRVVGCVLAISAVCMLWRAFARKRVGLIPLAAVLAVTAIFPLAAPTPWSVTRMGSHVARPTDVHDVAATYQWTAGTYELDLTRLPSTGTVRTSVREQVGALTVRLPASAHVRAQCGARLGHVDCLMRTRNGYDTNITVDNTPGGQHSGLTIDLDVSTVLGSIELRRQ